VFWGFVVFCVISAVVFFCKMKPSSKDSEESYFYTFHKEYLEINKLNAAKNTNKAIKRCLYGIYQNKQYVSKVIDANNCICLKIFTGTYNGVPRYEKYYIPIDALKADELQLLKALLKSKVGTSYVVK
jgi:hypothetical protein